MLCPECRANCSSDDVFCRRCGADLSIPSTSLVPTTSHLPAIAQHPQLPRLAAGVGALAVGFGLELLRRNLLARLEKPVRSTSKALTPQSVMGMKNPFTQQQSRSIKLPKGYIIEETAIYMSRVIRREK
ncbi:MAG TPA: hypothetical protein VIZ18_09605 [Ktedonobacteraceae bacterium]